jgi:ABC-type multidrug transport system ATPase subunit
VASVHFSVEEPSIAGFFGPNAAGKSTLLKVLASQAPTQAGAVRVFGLSYSDASRSAGAGEAHSEFTRGDVVDHLLTYERFKSHHFDPNAEYLHALTLR